MRKLRTLVPIPEQLAAAIDKVAGQKQREAFREAAGSWKGENHPEPAEVSASGPQRPFWRTRQWLGACQDQGFLFLVSEETRCEV